MLTKLFHNLDYKSGCEFQPYRVYAVQRALV